MEKQSETTKIIIETKKCIYFVENNKRKLLSILKKAEDERGDYFKIYTLILNLSPELYENFYVTLFNKMGVKVND